MKKTKENKGITLIALIITIIVMLILVGVSVNVALNGGLFDTAKTATEKTEQAAQTEKEYIVYVSLVAQADELVEKYPLDVEIVDNRRIKLLNDNMILLIQEIAGAYDIALENLTFSQAVKIANTFYDVYNKEIESHKESIVRTYFWEDFVNISGASSFMYGELNLAEEDNMKFLAVRNAYYFVTFVDDSIFVDTNLNNVKHLILQNPQNTFTDSMNTILDAFYPGGHFPIDEMTGTFESDFDQYAAFNGYGKICIMTEEIASRANSMFVINNTVVEDPNEYIGYAIVLISQDEYTEGTFPGNVDYAGLILKNIILINRQTGEIIYIDDNGQPNKSL